MSESRRFLSRKHIGQTCLLAAMLVTSRRCVVAFHSFRYPTLEIRNGIRLDFSHRSTHSGQTISRIYTSRDYFVRSMSTISTTHDTSSSIIKRVKTKDAVPMDQTVSIQGWIRTVRKQKTLAFVEVNDGSSLSGIQCVLPFDSMDNSTKDGM